MRPLKAGDLFRIPTPDGRYGVGQIARGGVVMWIVVFRDLFSELTTPQDLGACDLLLSAWTTDAFFFHGRWIVCGNSPVAEDRIPRPSYVVQQDGEFFVESFDGSELRPATQFDLNLLKYRFNVAPIRVQNALLAHHGFGVWDPDYEELTVETAWKWTLV
jgi:hypothetical protein